MCLGCAPLLFLRFQRHPLFDSGVRRKAQALGPLGVALAAAIGVALVYVIFVGTHPGRAVDSFLVDRLDEGGWEPGADAVIGAINIVTAPLVAVVIAAAALRSGGWTTALRVIVLIAGASLTARGLKELLGAVDPLGGETKRDLGSGFYPSGHAALIASLCLAAVLAAPARRRRQVAMGAAAAAAVLLVWAVPVGGSHHPSDVLGGALVAVGWAAVCWQRGRGAVREMGHAPLGTSPSPGSRTFPKPGLRRIY